MKYILAILLIAIIAIAGCDGAPENGEQQENPEEMQKQPQEEQQQETSNNNALESLKEFFSMKTQLEYMVQYNINANVAGQQTSTAMTHYVKGITRMRTDTETQGMELRTVIDNGKIYTCTTATGQWMCFETEVDMSMSDIQQAEVEDNPEQYDIRALPDRTIAGVQTKCFEIDVEDGKVSYCYSPQGVPLYVKTEGTTEGIAYLSEMTATAYSTTVSDSVFEIPAEPGAMPDFGNYQMPNY